MTTTKNYVMASCAFCVSGAGKGLTMKKETNESYQTDALLRLPEVLEIIPVSRAHWWAGVKSGKYPPSIKLSSRVTCWKRSSVLALLEQKEG